MLVYYLTPICFLVAGLIGKTVVHPPPDITAQESSATLDSTLTRLGDLGLHSTVADFFWIYTNLESDLEHYEGGDLNNWMHRRFELISHLDELFYENYLWGGQFLMIVKDDLIGAEKLLGDGLKHYPEDLNLNWQMGYLMAYELRDLKRAYPYFLKVKNSPNRPPMFDTLFARLSSDTLSPTDSLTITYQSWQQAKDDSPLKERLGLLVYSMKAQIDLNCLNEGKSGCETKDFEGKPYRNEKGVWTASKPLLKTGLHFPKKKSN